MSRSLRYFPFWLEPQRKCRTTRLWTFSWPSNPSLYIWASLSVLLAPGSSKVQYWIGMSCWSNSVYVWPHIYIYMCVCVSVCVNIWIGLANVHSYQSFQSAVHHIISLSALLYLCAWPSAGWLLESNKVGTAAWLLNLLAIYTHIHTNLYMYNVDSISSLVFSYLFFPFFHSNNPAKLYNIIQQRLIYLYVRISTVCASWPFIILVFRLLWESMV